MTSSFSIAVSSRCLLEHRLVYALVGLYRVAESVRAQSVPALRWSENVHTRCVDLDDMDVIDLQDLPGDVSGFLTFYEATRKRLEARLKSALGFD